MGQVEKETILFREKFRNLRTAPKTILCGVHFRQKTPVNSIELDLSDTLTKLVFLLPLILFSGV